MHKLEIKLKQHTPVIHFQHDQEGATLRASEVKPKLDKFIIKTEFGDDFEKCKQYLIGYSPDSKKIKLLKEKFDKGYRALDYKIRIEAKNVLVWDARNIPLYFGNMPSKDDVNYKDKLLTFSPDSSPVTMTFFSFKEDLIKLIDDQIALFFMLHNFGTRQSKGFGSFCREGYDSKAEQILKGKNYAKFTWKADNKTFGTKDLYVVLFSDIDFFYKSLRSGVNQNGVYFRSLMYFYAKSPRINSYWDKRAIRYKFQHFTPNMNEDKGEEYDQDHDGDPRIDKAKMFRDMLGLSSPQTWKAYNDTITKKHNPQAGEEEITRFKSPLTIKPIYDAAQRTFKVFLLPEQIPDRFKGAEFEIFSSTKSESLKMSTPTVFDVDDFLKFVANSKVEVIRRLQGQPEGRIRTTLESIYNQIHYVEGK